MKRIIFEDVHELSAEMLHDALNFSDCVSAVCHYDMATALLSELIQSEVPIGQINISDYEWSGYDKEYVISLMDGNVYCSPAYRMKKDGYHRDSYLETYADVMYVHQDCNSMVLKYIDCDKIFEFSVNDYDEIDDGYECCDCHSELNEDEIVSHNSNYVTVSRDKYGTPTGFTKSWSRNNGDGVTQYSSYTYYCNNEGLLRNLAHDLDIEL